MVSPANISRPKILGNIATLLSGSVVAQLMTALALLLTARQLTADGYGRYSACVAITSLTSIVFSLGLDIWLLREGGRETQRLKELAGSVITIKAGLGIIWMLLFAVLAPLLNQDTYPIGLIRWSMLLIWLDTLLATTLTAFKSALINKVPAILEACADFIWFGSTILLIFYGANQPEVFIKIRVIISLAALIVALLLLTRIIGFKYKRGVVIDAIRNVFPFATSEFLGMVTLRADVVIIGLTLGEYATGIYSPAVGLINMALLAPMAVYTVMLPVLGNLYRSHPQQAIKTSYRTIALSFVIGVGLTMIFLFGAPLVVLVLGQSYQASVAVIRILSLVLLFKCVSFAMAAIMIATDKQTKRTIVQTISAAVNVVLNLSIVYLLGVKGVAGVYVITEIILLIGYSWVVWHKNER
jgi:O-antigen/teichoic acid export membrane protein